jgi:hypothetical protein
MFQSTVCPNTIMEGVQQIMPRILTSMRASLNRVRYWTFGSSFKHEIGDYAEACKMVTQVIV